MQKKRIKKVLILITLFLYVIILACFTHSDLFKLLKNQNQQVRSQQTYGKQHGIDPTPLPPKPNPDVSE